MSLHLHDGSHVTRLANLIQKPININQDTKSTSAGMKISTGLPSLFRKRSKQRSSDALICIECELNLTHWVWVWSIRICSALLPNLDFNKCCNSSMPWCCGHRGFLLSTRKAQTNRANNGSQSRTPNDITGVWFKNVEPTLNKCVCIYIYISIYLSIYLFLYL